MNYIISSKLIPWLNEQGVDFPSHSSYPDGSVLTRNSNLVAKAQRLIHERLGGAYGSAIFRSLACFLGSGPKKNVFTLMYPGRYLRTSRKYSEDGIVFGPALFSPVQDNEDNASCLRLAISLCHSWTEDNVKSMERSLKKWFSGIGSQGVFGENGIVSIANKIYFRDHIAGCEINAIGSGQNTINTLYLNILEWSIGLKLPLDEVNFAPGKEWDLLKEGQFLDAGESTPPSFS